MTEAAGVRTFANVDAELAVGRLTDRQVEVLRLRALGLSGKQTAHEMGLSVRTIKNHMHDIYERLEVANLAGACCKVGWMVVP